MLTSDASKSLAEDLASLPESDRQQAIQSLTEAQAQELLHDWRFWARPKQLAPAGDWDTWAIRAGRGFGKTRSGSGWVHERAMSHPGRWTALVARNSADARDYMIEGPGGFLKNTAPHERPVFEVSKRRLTWPNGSWATIYTDEDPDQVRGFSGDTAWLDEFAKYKHPEDVWDNLSFGMREASLDQPRKLITTTPRPLKVLREIEKDPRTVVVVGSSHENRANLDPKWFANTLERYRGTRIGRQEIEAEILEDVPGALWTRRMLDEGRVKREELPELTRIIVAVDPAASSDESANENGIVVVGTGYVGGHQHGYVLDDWSVRGTPDEWGRKAVAAFRMHSADRIVAEKNMGGEMVEHVIKSVDRMVPVTLVSASRGKLARAEPISALYEQNRVHHCGTLGDLEDQMISWTPQGALANAAPSSRQQSPDRVDALVWGLSELFPNITSAERNPAKPPPAHTNNTYSPTRAWIRPGPTRANVR